MLKILCGVLAFRLLCILYVIVTLQEERLCSVLRRSVASSTTQRLDLCKSVIAVIFYNAV